MTAVQEAKERLRAAYKLLAAVGSVGGMSAFADLGLLVASHDALEEAGDLLAWWAEHPEIELSWGHLFYRAKAELNDAVRDAVKAAAAMLRDQRESQE